MNRIIRLTYASTATFERSVRGGIESEVGRILVQSRNNNSRAKIGGVLHYGNGYFFQCLEGDAEKVNETYARINQDKRHKAVLLLSETEVTERLFKDWSMKYMPIESSIKTLLAKHGYSTFDPYKFDPEFVDELLAECVKGSDPSADRSNNKSTPVTAKQRKPEPSLFAKLKRAFN